MGTRIGKFFFTMMWKGVFRSFLVFKPLLALISDKLAPPGAFSFTALKTFWAVSDVAFFSKTSTTEPRLNEVEEMLDTGGYLEEGIEVGWRMNPITGMLRASHRRRAMLAMVNP